MMELSSCSSFSPKVYIHNTEEYEGIEILYYNLPKKGYKEIVYIESISIISPKKAFDKIIEKAKERKADAIIISNHGLGNYTGVGIKYL